MISRFCLKNKLKIIHGLFCSDSELTESFWKNFPMTKYWSNDAEMYLRSLYSVKTANERQTTYQIFIYLLSHSLYPFLQIFSVDLDLYWSRNKNKTHLLCRKFDIFHCFIQFRGEKVGIRYIYIYNYKYYFTERKV